MTETEVKTRKKYVPPDGKPAYRIGVVPASDPSLLQLAVEGFESSAAALKWAKGEYVEAGVKILVIRIVDNKTSEAVPAKTRWL